jgi:hypothetical protein
MASLANSGSHSSKIEAEKLGNRLGDSLKANRKHPPEKRTTTHSKEIENLFIMAHRPRILVHGKGL